MMKIIGIRREDKNKWERRTPLVPADVKELKEKFDIHTVIQPSKIRTFSDEEYLQTGAEINEDLSRAEVVFAIKEIPEEFFLKDRTYVFFSHTIKGQSQNMAMLKRMVELNTNLIDYERILNNKNQRLIFFGNYAGLAGMIETLQAFGQKIKLRGYKTPFEKIKQPYQYNSLNDAKKEIAEIGEEIAAKGLPFELTPLVVGFAGYGNVSGGAQEIFDLLPHKTVSAGILEEMYENFRHDNHCLYKVVFKEEDLVKPLEGNFDLQDYYDHPDKYQSQFENFIPNLQILLNCIYWSEKYPRLVSKEYLRNSTILQSNLNLKVIGDISCDINGAIEITHKATTPDLPTFTYFADKDCFQDGIARRGVTVMAVDNLPCEFPREASENFSTVLKDLVNDIVKADFISPTRNLSLPFPVRKALILHKGEFTEDYEYMKKFLKEEES